MYNSVTFASSGSLMLVIKKITKLAQASLEVLNLLCPLSKC